MIFFAGKKRIKMTENRFHCLVVDTTAFIENVDLQVKEISDNIHIKIHLHQIVFDFTSRIMLIT